MSSTRWPLVGLGIGVFLSVLCWVECEANYIQRFSMANIGLNMDSNSFWKDSAAKSKDGLDEHEYRCLGYVIESKHDWRGYRPTEYRGLPGGRWTLYATVFITCTLLGLLPMLMRKREKVPLR